MTIFYKSFFDEMVEAYLKILDSKEEKLVKRLLCELREKSLRIEVNMSLEQLLNELREKSSIKDIKNELNGKFNLFIKEILVVVRTSKIDAWGRFKKFLEYIKKQFNVPIDIDLAMPEVPLEKTERLFEILKILQGEGMTRKEISEKLMISDRTLLDDLNSLSIDGIDFLGQHIKIQHEEKNGQVYYSSTVHPIFLPLNLTQAYDLVVCLKRSSRAGRARGDILNELSDWIFSQLTDYGKDIINNSLESQGLNIKFDEVVNSYEIEDKLKTRLVGFCRYMEKRQNEVKITCRDGRKEFGKIRFEGEQVELKREDNTVLFIYPEEISNWEEIPFFRIDDGVIKNLKGKISDKKLNVIKEHKNNKKIYLEDLENLLRVTDFTIKDISTIKRYTKVNR